MSLAVTKFSLGRKDKGSLIENPALWFLPHSSFCSKKCFSSTQCKEEKNRLLMSWPTLSPGATNFSWLLAWRHRFLPPPYLLPRSCSFCQLYYATTLPELINASTPALAPTPRAMLALPALHPSHTQTHMVNPFRMSS